MSNIVSTSLTSDYTQLNSENTLKRAEAYKYGWTWISFCIAGFRWLGLIESSCHAIVLWVWQLDLRS